MRTNHLYQLWDIRWYLHGEHKFHYRRPIVFDQLNLPWRTFQALLTYDINVLPMALNWKTVTVPLLIQWPHRQTPIFIDKIKIISEIPSSISMSFQFYFHICDMQAHCFRLNIEVTKNESILVVVVLVWSLLVILFEFLCECCPICKICSLEDNRFPLGNFRAIFFFMGPLVNLHWHITQVTRIVKNLLLLTEPKIVNNNKLISCFHRKSN